MKEALMVQLTKLRGIETILRGLQASENLDDTMQDACSVLADVIDNVEKEIRKGFD